MTMIMANQHIPTPHLLNSNDDRKEMTMILADQHIPTPHLLISIDDCKWMAMIIFILADGKNQWHHRLVIEGAS